MIFCICFILQMDGCAVDTVSIRCKFLFTIHFINIWYLVNWNSWNLSRNSFKSLIAFCLAKGYPMYYKLTYQRQVWYFGKYKTHINTSLNNNKKKKQMNSFVILHRLHPPCLFFLFSANIIEIYLFVSTSAVVLLKCKIIYFLMLNLM